MTVLVAYASKHGATQGIAEHIAEQLGQLGKQAEARPVEEVSDPSSYDVFVIGSAVYYGSWLKEATEWVHRTQAVLAERPVWLFSVGPLGTEVKDTEPQPKEMAEFQQAIHPRDQRIFFGALDHNRLSFPERMVVKATSRSLESLLYVPSLPAMYRRGTYASTNAGMATHHDLSTPSHGPGFAVPMRHTAADVSSTVAAICLPWLRAGLGRIASDQDRPCTSGEGAGISEVV